MPLHIAFLRAINVGGRVVKMDQLRARFEGLGLANVETFIASGNVIFESPVRKAKALEARIEAHLRDSLGYAVGVFIRSPAELAAVAGHRPFPAADLEAGGNTLYISFVADPPGPEAAERLRGLRTDLDDFHVHGREVYWLCRTKISQSEVTGAKFERAVGVSTTMRNATTVRKLAAKYPVNESRTKKDI
ncbi:MAG TPA: DUF1697 domain-containing protein [Gemmataceae bacterium]|nr:DUF1697 domain-containing protein [Gemmataceae bacterium]